ncbi:MAG: hypothetical protein WC657_09580, partial [Candidatus Paceibacterota bacterium]
MPILNFQRRFVPKILDGSKVHTIRDFGARDFRSGQTLYMQTGPRFNPERFATHPCLRVREVVLRPGTCMIWNEDFTG